MARPQADFPPREAIRALIDQRGRLGVKVIPGARTEAVAIVAGHLVVKVREQPEDGKATLRVAQLLTSALEIATSRLRLLRGATGRDKIFEIVD